MAKEQPLLHSHLNWSCCWCPHYNYHNRQTSRMNRVFSFLFVKYVLSERYHWYYYQQDARSVIRLCARVRRLRQKLNTLPWIQCSLSGNVPSTLIISKISAGKLQKCFSCLFICYVWQHFVWSQFLLFANGFVHSLFPRGFHTRRGETLLQKNISN